MPLKTTFDPGDPVYWSIDIQVGEDSTTATIDAKVVEVNREHNIALLKYYLQSVGHKQAWVPIAKLTPKSYIAPTEGERLRNAKQKFSDSVWDAPVIWDDRYFDSVEEAKAEIFDEWAQDENPNPDDLPDLIWAAKTIDVSAPSVVDYFIDSLEDIYEDLCEEYRSKEAVKILTEAEAKIAEIMGQIKTWECDRDIAIRLDWDNLLHDFKGVA